jgi:hypothetical protein
MGVLGWKQGKMLRLPPAGRFFFNMVVFLQLEWGVCSGYEGCLRYRSVGLSKAVLLSCLLWMEGVGRRGNGELGTGMGV